MKLRSNDQNRKLHVLLTQAGLTEEKSNLVSKYSNGRTESSKELYMDEAKSLIQDLERQLGKSQPVQQKKSVNDAASKMRRKIIAICYTIGWIENTDDPEERKVNMAKIDLFLKHRGYLKKPLRDYKESELPKLVTQFELIQRNEQVNAGGKALKELLAELNIKITPQDKA